jgi:hypothetical protein
MQGWKQHGPTFEARSKATILLHGQFRIVLVYAHTQSLGKKYGENFVPCRDLSAKWPPRWILVCQAVSEDTCQNWHLCNCTWGAQIFCAGGQDLNFSLHDLPLLAGKAKERQGRAPYQARKMEMSQS